MSQGWSTWVLGLAALGGAAACGSLGSSADSGGGSKLGHGDSVGADGSFSPGSGAGAGGGSSGPPPPLPPEVELSADFERPQAGVRFVYAASPERDRVAVIDSETLAIHTVEVGDQPRFLQTLAGRDEAIVLNVSSADAHVIRTSGDGSRATKVAVRRGSNAIAVSPDGRHAVVYFDETFTTGPAQGSFQDVSVLTLGDEGDRAVGITVGFRPSRVSFSSDGTRGFVVTEDGVSVLDFTAIDASSTPGVARTVPLGATGIDATLDVSVTPDGAYALAREQGSSELRLVDLETEVIRRLDLAHVVARATLPGDGGTTDAGSPDAGSPDARAPDTGAPDTGAPDTGAPDAGPLPLPDAGTRDDAAPPDDGGAADAAAPPVAPSFTATATSPVTPVTITDVDLAPSGDYALAVARDRSAVIRVPVPAAFLAADASSVVFVPGELIGSVSITPDGRFATLYTTADPSNERLSILDLASEEARTVQLRKSIAAVAAAPDGRTALIVHQKLPGDPNEFGLDAEAKLDRADGYSLVDLEVGFPKIEKTAAPLGPSVITPDGNHLFVLFNAPGIQEAHRVNLRSFQVQPMALGSPPVSVGAIPGSSRVFIGQDHPDGRISFVDWNSGEMESVTGFELNSRIRE